ncbi:MAG: PEP-CTERM sorting domain-containing protein [Verrucomicrobia bacterium]|nr:PEP-CTERM sorting domain-containing protein [Verrucomicrobiota bacterium]MCH8510713.1 PEP-CTERM sorting domain-containing protein [Kiritimatiellia bacterium]
MNIHKTLLATVLIGVLGLPPASAELFFSESFDYGDTRDNIQNVSDWQTTSGVLYYDPDGLSHPGMPGEVGGSFHHDFGSGNRAINYAVNIDKLSTASAGDEFWLTGLIQLENHDGQSRVQFLSGSNVDGIGFGVNSSGNVQFYGSINEGANTWTDTGATAAADGSTYLFLVQAIRGSGSFSDRESTINFWFDPQDTSSQAALGLPDFTNGLSKFGRDGVWNEVTIGLSNQSRADEIRFGDSFNAVMIPEPGTLVLVGLAVGFLIHFRRRR